MVASLLAGAVLAAPAANAHEADPRVRSVVTQVTVDVPGLVVEVGRSVADQLLVTNPSDVELEVLDDDGTAFLRIGPDGVLGNLEEPAFHRSIDPFGTASVPANADGEAPRWGRVSREPSYGWFDHRLHPSQRGAPTSAQPGDVLATWEVPVRAGSQRGVIRGEVRFEPLRGAYRAALVDGPYREDGVVVTVLDGVVPAVLVQNDGDDHVLVLGADGEAFLRVTPTAVEANLASPQWHTVARLESGRPVPTVDADATATPTWEQVATVPRIAWLELRAHVADSGPDDPTRSVEVARWTLPLRIGGRDVVLEGVTRWEPVAAAANEDASGAGWLPIVALIAALAGVVAWLRLRRPSGAPA